jgi:molybdate transport system permease protein
MDTLLVTVLTLQIALVATVINVPIAVGLSWLIIKKRVRGSFVLDIVASLPLALPPVVVGYLLLILLGRNGPLGGLLNSLFGVEIVFTWVAAALAAAIVSFPLMARTIMVSMRGVDDGLERSARSLGAGPWRVFFTITIPLAYRGILAGVLLGFVRAMSEFGATIIVAGSIPGSTQTLPLAIFSRVQLGDNDVALRLVVVSVVLAIVTLALHNWLLERSQEKSSSR